MLEVKVIGAGLAGCEAAWQLAERGIHVTLTEMKPQKMTPAHHCADFAELVCSNSLRGDRLENAVGLLKEELRRLHSLENRAPGFRIRPAQNRDEDDGQPPVGRRRDRPRGGRRCAGR